MEKVSRGLCRLRQPGWPVRDQRLLLSCRERKSAPGGASACREAKKGGAAQVPPFLFTRPRHASRPAPDKPGQIARCRRPSVHPRTYPRLSTTLCRAGERLCLIPLCATRLPCDLPPHRRQKTAVDSTCCSHLTSPGRAHAPAGPGPEAGRSRTLIAGAHRARRQDEAIVPFRRGRLARVGSMAQAQCAHAPARSIRCRSDRPGWRIGTGSIARVLAQDPSKVRCVMTSRSCAHSVSRRGWRQRSGGGRSWGWQQCRPHLRR